MDEPLAEFYYKELEKEENNKTNVLVNFCIAIFGDRILVNGFYGRTLKLVNIYGYKSVFYGILSVSNVENIEGNQLLNFVAYWCNKNLEKKFSNTEFNDLSSFVEKTKKSMGKTRRLKIPKRENE